MYVNLSKKFITHNLLIYLDKSSFGRPLKVPLWKIVRAIIYRLKTGCQWRELPLQSLFGKKIIRWQSVYYHFNKWSKDGSWKRIWIAVLKARKYTLDMSQVFNLMVVTHLPKEEVKQLVIKVEKSVKRLTLCF